MKIPKDTSTFQYYNANPKNKHTTDCVIRAICTALEQSYEQTVKELIELWLETGYDMSEAKCFGKYIESKGWIKNKQPRKTDNTKYTGKEFVKTFKGVCVANIGGNHTVCIKDGKVLDIWDSTDGCIGNYWTMNNSSMERMEENKMDEAKMVWKLSNGEIVSIGDRVIANYGNDKYNISITDIGETYITGELDEGGEIDFYFSELEDVRLVK